MRTLHLGVVLMAGMLAAGLAAQKPAPERAGDLPAVTYVANAGFLLEGGGRRVLVDAAFDAGFNTYLAPSPELLNRLRDARPPFADVDLLLVTHPHGDHFNPRLVVAHMLTNARCRLVAHAQAVDLMRKQESFALIQNRIHEVTLERGGRERLTVNGIVVDVLCLPHGPYLKDGRDVHAQTANLAFVVALGGTHMLHVGDAMAENSLAFLNAFPFHEVRVDLLFGDLGASQAAVRLVAEKIKPRHIIAMHLAPSQLEEEAKKIRAAFPHAVVFRRSMERRSFPSERDRT